MTIAGLLLALELGEQDDQNLVRGLQRKDPAAMADLYDRFGRLAYSVIFAVVRNEAVAEDLVQETFLRVWNRAHTFDGERIAIGPWLLAIARNRAIDHVRSAGARHERNTFALEALEHPSFFADTERDLVNSDQARRLRLAIGKLDDHHRQVIELAYFEGLSHSEMAERMGQPLGTVKSWVEGR